MPALIDLLRSRLSSLLPAEIEANERLKLLTPFRHPMLISRHRAGLIVDRVRLFAFLFALLTPLWGIVDFIAFPYPLWGQLLVLRILVCLAFLSLLLFYRDQDHMTDAYLAMFILFAIPTLFYVGSHTLLAHYQLADMPAAVAAGYAFLPFVLMAGLALFPLTLLENLLVAVVLLAAQGLAGLLNWSTLNWPSFLGAFWLLILIAGVTSLACMSQLAYMVALLRRGGEEFLLVMPDTDMTRARQALERLKTNGLGSRPDGTPLTASIGLAERFFDQIKNPEDLLELADQRMYKAKAAGRNRIHVL